MKEKDCIPKPIRQDLNASIAGIMITMGTLPKTSEWHNQLRQPEDNKEQLEWLFGPHLPRIQEIYNINSSARE